MSIHEFSLKSLPSLDGGRVVEAFNQAVKRAVADCQDRPGEMKARTVTLQLDIVPVVDEDGMLGTVRGAFQIKESIPTRKSRVYDFQPRRGGMLVFNDLSDDASQQRTLDQAGPFLDE